MDMRDKVITGFMCLLSCTTPNDCSECGYECNTAIHVKTPVNMIFDAIDLLKAQEPKPVDEWPDEFLCPTCKTRLAGRSQDDCILLETNDTPNYCWVCGQAVKWK